MIQVNKNGDVVIIIKNENNSFNAAEEIQLRRDALYDLITEHNSKDFTDNNSFYGAVLLLRDLDPTEEQLNLLLDKEK